MNFKPLGDRVLIKRDDAETKSAGGIIIPDAVKEKPYIGTIIEAGPGAINERNDITPMNVSKGDRVMFAKWAGSEIYIDDELFLIVPEKDIIGVMDDE